jgi:hypothetical protein
MNKKANITYSLIIILLWVLCLPAPIKATSSFSPSKIVTTFGEDASTQVLISWQNHITDQYLELTSYADYFFTQSVKITPTVESFILEEYGHDQRYLFRVNLDNLTPGMSYRYRVGNNDSLSASYTFATASDKDFSFVFISDPQGSTLDHYLPITQISNRAYMEDPNLSFFMLGGDIADVGGIEAQYDYFFQSYNMLSKVPLITAIGNHDTMKANTNWTEVKNEARVYNAHFYNPNNGPDFAKNSTYYFYYNNTLFVSLNTQLDDTNLKAQATWLDNLLFENEANQKSQYIVVLMHRGIVGNYYYGNSTTAAINNIYRPIFDKYSVDLVLSGHDHNYSRTGKMYNNTKTTDGNGLGTIYLIGGTTGPKFNNQKADSLSQFEATATNIGVYTNINISSDKITLLAKTQNGDIIDKYYIPAKRQINKTEYISNITTTSFATSAILNFKVNNLNYIDYLQIEKLDGQVVAKLNAYDTSYHFKDLDADSIYKYRIRIVYLDKTSVLTPVEIKTDGFISVVNVTNKDIKVKFQVATSDVSSYRLYLNDKLDKTLSHYYSEYSFINLKSKSNYNIKIEAYDTSNNLIDSEIIFVRTQ